MPSQKIKLIYPHNGTWFNSSRRICSYKKRGLGYQPLNYYFRGSALHHLFLEGNKDFCVFVPDFLHSMFKHNPWTGAGMDQINAIAVSALIHGNEQFLPA